MQKDLKQAIIRCYKNFKEHNPNTIHFGLDSLVEMLAADKIINFNIRRYYTDSDYSHSCIIRDITGENEETNLVIDDYISSSSSIKIEPNKTEPTEQELKDIVHTIKTIQKDSENWCSKQKYCNYNLKINGAYLKEIFDSLDDEVKEDQEVEEIEDFRDYIKSTITSNLQYDFGTDVDATKLFN